MHLKRLIPIFLFFIVLTPSQAQDSLVLSDCWLCKNNQHTTPIPYHYGWKQEIPYLASSVGLLSTGIIIEKTYSIQPYTPQEIAGLNREDINAFDRNATYNWAPGLSTASDVLMIASIVSPVLFLTNKSTRHDFGWLALMSWEVLSINYGMVTTVKNLTKRGRPYVYNPNVPMEERTASENRESFYSNHASTTAAMSFFIATVLTDYHPDMKTAYKITVWSLAVLYPAVTAYLRVGSGKHFPTDVIAGYAIGAFTGWLVPFLHKKKKSSDKFSFAPISIQGNAGIYLSYKF
jgi:membrane-associated phospholipid phosphatase